MTWREFSREDIQAFFENGIGRVERVRLVRSTFDTAPRLSAGRGKGKKLKQWERGRYERRH